MANYPNGTCSTVNPEYTPPAASKQATDASVESASDRIQAALDIAWRYGSIGGDHHKMWVIDQMVRALHGDSEEYWDWVEAYEKPLSNNPDDRYIWDTGIAP